MGGGSVRKCLHVQLVLVVVLVLVCCCRIAGVAALTPLQLVSEAKRCFPQQGCPIGYRLLKDADTTITVRDFQNVVVYLKRFYRVPAGVQSFVWNGQDDNGRVLPAGDYRIELSVVYQDGERANDFMYVTLVADSADVPPVLSDVMLPVVVNGAAGIRFRQDFDARQSWHEERINTSINYLRGRNELRAVLEGIGTNGRSWDTVNSRASYLHKGTPLGYQLVWRDSLGDFDDPLQLFTDWKVDRAKSGVRLFLDTQSVKAAALGLASPSLDERGYAGRLRASPFTGAWIGVTHAGRSIDAGGRMLNMATALDTEVRISRALQFRAEYSFSNDSATHQSGDAKRAEFFYTDSVAKLNIGYQDVGSSFKADYAYLKYGTDAKGPDVELMLLLPWNTQALSRPTVQFSYARMESSAVPKTTDDFRANLRATLFRKWNIMLDGSVLAVDDHSGGLSDTAKSAQARVEYTYDRKNLFRVMERLAETQGSRSTDTRIEHEYRIASDTSIRNALEYIVTNSYGTVVREGVHDLEVRMKTWTLLLRNRITSPATGGTQYNIYGRLDKSFALFRTLDVRMFAAFGTPYGQQTANVVEAGLEVRF